MIGQVLVFLRDHLNATLSAASDWVPGESREDKVVFIDGEKMDPITFRLGAVSALLVNVEEDSLLRPADRYVALAPDGAALRVQPEIRINLYVLFVARFKRYEQGLDCLSQIIQHFQGNRTFDHHNAPDLDEGVEKLVLELVTLPFAEQNEMWNALRTTYHPSVLYKVKMVVFRDQDPGRLAELRDKDLRLAQ